MSVFRQHYCACVRRSWCRDTSVVVVVDDVDDDDDDDAVGYRAPVPTSSTRALFNSQEHRNSIRLVSDQAAAAAAAAGLHDSDVTITSSTASSSSQSSSEFLRDVILAWFILASVRCRFSRAAID